MQTVCEKLSVNSTKSNFFFFFFFNLKYQVNLQKRFPIENIFFAAMKFLKTIFLLIYLRIMRLFDTKRHIVELREMATEIGNQSDRKIIPLMEHAHDYLSYLMHRWNP